MTPPRRRIAVYAVRHRPSPRPASWGGDGAGGYGGNGYGGADPVPAASLLVFDHVGLPGAGTQVPAGGVEAGESLEEAVLREVAEETGLCGVTVDRAVGEDHSPHPETGRPRHTTFFLARVPPGTPDVWTHHVGGAGTDAGLVLACFFVPLPLSRPLADAQHRLLPRAWALGARADESSDHPAPPGERP